mmetsp:Transcript_8214/g.21518  ORF Transcript_8214/g.21518 Transcript_8214/m.21518 type:complete len:309 (+) Transcript_8214:400-1326(+)
MCKFACGRAGACEDGRSIAVSVLVDELNGFVERVYAQHLQHGAEDLVLVALHVCGHIREDRRAYPVALGVAVDSGATAVERDARSSFNASRHEAIDPLLGLGRDDGGNLDSWSIARADDEPTGHLRQLRHQRLRAAHQHNTRDGHTALASRAEGRCDQGLHGRVRVGVLHYDSMILRAEIGLDTLAVRATSLIDVLARRVTADERDGLDLGSVADEVDGVVLAMDDVEHAVGKASLEGELGEAHGCERHSLRGLHHIRVSARDAHREHPQRYHGWEVERSDARAHSKRVAVGMHIGGIRDTSHRLTHL